MCAPASDHKRAPLDRKAALTLYPWLIPLINCGLGALQVKRTVVELTASACTFPGGTVGTDAHKKTEREETTLRRCVGGRRAEHRQRRTRRRREREKKLVQQSSLIYPA